MEEYRLQPFGPKVFKNSHPLLNTTMENFTFFHIWDARSIN